MNIAKVVNEMERNLTSVKLVRINSVIIVRIAMGRSLAMVAPDIFQVVAKSTRNLAALHVEKFIAGSLLVTPRN